MEIKASELKAVLGYLLEFQKEVGKESFQVDVDYYWNIIREERYNLYEEPSTFTLGQLTWDWENLQKTLAEKDDTTLYHLVWLGQILIAIGLGDIKHPDPPQDE